MIRVTVSAEPIDVAAETAGACVEGAGGIATFIGQVRADDGVTRLTLEHYPGATERSLEAIAEAAAERFGCSELRIVHRVGPMVPGEPIVFVAAAAAHRAPALEACAFCIDRLKTGAPFWKRETTGAGERWVEARDADEAAAERWS